jgi:hypothetical protein
VVRPLPRIHKGPDEFILASVQRGISHRFLEP